MKQFVLIFTTWIAAAIISVSASTADDVEFFETRIRPVLVKHCYECHSSGSAEVKGGLLLDFRQGVRNGGETAPAVIPGKPEDSLLLEALRYESFEMPPKQKLPDAIIADFEQWIRNGAADPRDEPPSATEAADQVWKELLAERSQWWSLQPPQPVTPPTVNNDAWSKEPVDCFVLAALNQARLSAAKPADGVTLLRRLAFVLTGLPPTPKQVQTFPPAFTTDADAAVARLVDEILESPHFGEHFARHWMDVVRYTDTYGYEWDNPARGSWEYRDYLIRAFNDDIGFDQLIREQIAGDLLPEPRINDAAGVNESLIAPMFYHMGEHRHGSSLEFNGVHQEMVNNKVDAFSKAFLAMTVACARCHDHKLDAISQADYYALAGVFMTPRWTARVIDAPGKHDAEIAELKRLRDAIQQRIGAAWASPGGVLASGPSLRKWAQENPSSFTAAKIEDIGWPFAQLLTANASTEVVDEAVRNTWQRLATEWRTTRESRQKANAETFDVLTDFSKPGFPGDWVVEGDGFEHGYVTRGTVLVNLEGEPLISQLLPRGYHTRALSSKLPGALRLPEPERFPRSIVSLRLAGGEWAGRRAIPQNAFLNEGPVFFDPSAPSTWTAISRTGLNNGVTRVLTEITTASLNSNFPPRTGVATAGKVTLPHDDEGVNKRSWFSVTGVVAHNAGGSPADTLDAFVTLFSRRDESDERTQQAEYAPATADESWQRLSEWLRAAIDRWAAGNAEPGDVRLLNWLLDQKLILNEAAALPKIAIDVQRYREVEAMIAFPRSANSMDERGVEPVNYRLNVRGNVDDDGPAIPRNFLSVFAGKHGVADSSESGRRELAEYLSRRDNPQTARVYVNRVWQWIFGQGIVATPSDFGKLGDRPSHPELLDWLATQFMEEGWSTKTLVRRLVLSRTFRQSGSVTQTATDRDPDNRLLHHYPTRRLQAEAIRDSLLAVSGRLDARLYGPPINPPRSVEDPAKRLFSGTLDSNGRRSIYMEMSIMDPPKFLVCFNLPDLKLPTGRRDVTNVPAQALVLLNDPLVVQLAGHWAEQLIQDGCTTAEQRIDAMFLQALGRVPSDQELHRWTNAVTGFSISTELMTDKIAWSELAHALFNTKEFIYYR